MGGKTFDLRFNFLVALLFALFFAACSDDTQETGTDEDDVEEQEAITREENAYSTLSGNFYTSSEPSKGKVLDEARPSERSEACELYEEALEDFERYLPCNEGDEKFITRSADGIVVSIDGYGTVKFAPADGDGVVARIDISLKDLPEYTVLYRHSASFGDNDSQIQLWGLFNPGDLVEFVCPKEWGGATDIFHAKQKGVVIKVEYSKLQIFTDHHHQYQEEDHWKTVTFDYGCASQEEWRTIYQSYTNDRDLFLDTRDNNKSESVAAALCNIMEKDGEFENKYVCAKSNDYDIHRSLYRARKTWYAKATRIAVANLRNGDFTVQTVWYAFQKKIRNIDCAYFSLITLDAKSTAKSVTKIYPVY